MVRVAATIHYSTQFNRVLVELVALLFGRQSIGVNKTFSTKSLFFMASSRAMIIKYRPTFFHDASCTDNLEWGEQMI